MIFDQHDRAVITAIGTLDGTLVERDVREPPVEQIDTPSEAAADGDISFAYYTEDEALATRVGTLGWPPDTDNLPPFIPSGSPDVTVVAGTSREGTIAGGVSRATYMLDFGDGSPREAETADSLGTLYWTHTWANTGDYGMVALPDDSANPAVGPVYVQGIPTVTGAPVLSSVNPNTGTATVNANYTLTGSNFTPESVVKYDANTVPAQAVAWIDPTTLQITEWTAAFPGTLLITVETINGTSAALPLTLA
jgi:hypothetical protein